MRKIILIALLIILTLQALPAETEQNYTPDEAKFISNILNQPEPQWRKIINQNRRIINPELLKKLESNIENNLEQNRVTGAWMLSLLADEIAGSMKQEQIYRLGLAMYYLEKKKQYGTAMDICQNVLLTDPKNKRVYLVKAQLYEATKNYKAAYYYYSEALKNDPKNDQIYLMIGDLYLKVQDKEKARAAYLKAKEINPQGQALLYLDKLDKFNVPTPQADDQLNPLVEKGQKALDSGDYNQAEKCFQEALKIEPRSPKAIAGMAGTYLKTNQDDKALTLLKKAIDEYQLKDPEMYRLLGNTLEVSAERTGLKYYLEQAIEAYDQAIALNPDDVLSKVYRERAEESLKKF